MKKILISALFFLSLFNNAIAKTEWYTETMPNGLAILTGVFTKSGIGLTFGCTGDFFSAGAMVLNTDKSGIQPNPMQIKVTAPDNESANFIAEPIKSSPDLYTFMSSNAMASLSTFHFLDTANKKPLMIELKNEKLSMNNKWIVDTTESGNAIKEFKKNCQLINN
ncbi:hypothetical protein [Enterobacter asburiae]|uniref:hypothetical protein n=1 Tax=Enterobacter asburiae TaxID=61645 RepID=UPI00210D56B7|nr:hypothetical protein [Enterobacter asburiae]MCQ4369980.1 hypothetical protein [Enterobacter asburiae]HDC4619829.1 hypothetical protein [Enterobacter asburiae]